jgi:hypothetical protein
MKKKIKQTITVEIAVCNICQKEISHRPSNYKRYEIRLEVVRGLGKTADFDAHPTCINKVIRNAFAKYL